MVKPKSVGPYPAKPILVVDDEPQMCRLLKSSLEVAGLSNVVTCTDSREVLPFLEERAVSLLLLDVMMPGVSGEELLERIRELHPEVPVIMVTGQSDCETAIRCMRMGAHDYLLKPFEVRRMHASVMRSLEVGELQDQYRTYVRKSVEDTLDYPEAFQEIVTSSSRMRAIFQYIETIAPLRKPVLITGESGVGKELLARAVHELSGAPGPFVSENVAGYDDAMFSDAVFGHVTGAYTGAVSDRPGLVDTAHNGSLFLDEIGDLSPQSQVKLLRLVQERVYRPLGADATKRSTARLIFATNHDLFAMQKEDAFRRDLYYRISIHHIEIPPLRQRRGDIALLVRHFVERAAAELDREPPAIPDAVFQLLRNYSFPGNVRELEAMVYNAVSRAQGPSLSLAPFRDHMERHGAEPAPAENNGFDANGGDCLYAGLPELPTLAEAREALVEEAMRRAEGNQGIAAHMLGISRTALNKRLKQR